MTHVLFLTGMIALLVAGCGFTSTSPGEAVVFSRFGAVDPTCYPAGFYLYNPLTTSRPFASTNACVQIRRNPSEASSASRFAKRSSVRPKYE